jgi:hypothetical protein
MGGCARIAGRARKTITRLTERAYETERIPNLGRAGFRTSAEPRRIPSKLLVPRQFSDHLACANTTGFNDLCIDTS